MSTPVTEQAAALQVEATSRALHLPTVRQQAGALAEAALRDRLTHLAYLAEVLSAELDDRDARRLKHLADFDLAAAPPSTRPCSPRWSAASGSPRASPSCCSATAAPASRTC